MTNCHRDIGVTNRKTIDKPGKGQLFFVTVMEGRSKWVFGRGRSCQIRSQEDVKTGRTINSFTKWEIWVSFPKEMNGHLSTLVVQ